MIYPYHKRIPTKDYFDEVRMVTVPRFKESGISGNEWRTSVAIELMFKGHVIYRKIVGDMPTALLMVGNLFVCGMEPLSDEYLIVEEKKCDQPGCPEDASIRLKLKREVHEDGTPKPDRIVLMFRKFCSKHSIRGNGDIEDSDKNYEPSGDA